MSVQLSKLPRATPNKGAAGGAGPEARTGLEESGREGSHSSEGRSRVSAAGSRWPHKEPCLPTLGTLHGVPPASLANSQTWEVEGHRACPRRHWGKTLALYTQHWLSLRIGLFTSDLPRNRQLSFTRTPIQHKMKEWAGMLAIARLWATSTPPLLSLSQWVIFLTYICELDLAITAGPAEVSFIMMEKSATDLWPPKGHPGTSHSTHGGVVKQQPSALLMSRHLSHKRFV